MNKITIEIADTSTSARITQVTDKSSVTIKNIPVSSLPQLIKDSCSNTQKDSDTGYISPNLIRESVLNGQTHRLYMFPRLTFTGHIYYPQEHYSEDELIQFNSDNSLGITLEDGHIVFPDFSVRNFGLLISNTNNEDFICVRHNYGCITTDFFDRPNDQSLLNFAFLNHFDNRVCWHGSFNQDVLNSRDTFTQGLTVYNYLNSNFNSDLNLRNSPSMEAINKYKDEGLKDFLEDLFTESYEDILDRRDHHANVVIEIAIMYFLLSKLNLKFEDVMEVSSNMAPSDASRLISEYM